MQAGNKISAPPGSPSDAPENGSQLQTVGSSGASPAATDPTVNSSPDRDRPADTVSQRSKSEVVKFSCSKSCCACFKTLLAQKAPSFLWCCCCCREERRLSCSLASTATKVMNLILLLLITILSCCFIIPPNVSQKKDTTDVDHLAPAYFFPCGDEEKVASKENFHFFKVLGFWEDCRGHAGYFFVYRFFFCLVVFYTIMSLLTFNVTSTKKAPLRANLHHGFWFYKFLIIVGLMLIACLAIRVYQGAAFEYVMMWVGLLGAYFFAFMEMVCVLDALEFLLTKAKSSVSPKKFKIFYWILTGFVYTIGAVAIIIVGLYNTTRNHATLLDRHSSEERKFFGGMDEDDETDIPSKTFCAVHIGLLIYDAFVGLFITMTIFLVKRLRTDRGHRFPNLGFLHAALIFLYTVFQSWSAISNSTDIECRFVSFPYNAYEKNKDVTFTPQGLLNGLIAVFAILYYTFANGVKSKAPWTVSFNKVWYLASGEPAEPGDPPPEPLRAWNDEKKNVTYSWPLYYITLILGSLSLMMAMTNYANPHAASAAAGNEAAVAIKMLATASCILFFMIPIMKGCRSVSPDEEAQEQKQADNAAVEDVNLSGQTSPVGSGSPVQLSQEQPVPTSPVVATSPPV